MYKKIIALYLLYLAVFLLGTAVLYLRLGQYFVFLNLIPMGIIGWYISRIVKANPDDYEKAKSILSSTKPYYGRWVLYFFILTIASIFIIAYLQK